jgi:hypothetical protein
MPKAVAPGVDAAGPTAIAPVTRHATLPALQHGLSSNSLAGIYVAGAVGVKLSFSPPFANAHLS